MMPEIGDIVRGKDIGRKQRYPFIWLNCPDCGKERWVRLIKGKPEYLRCHICAINKYQEKITSKCIGTRHKTGGGYIDIYVGKNNFFYPMVDKHSRIKEHRLVMAKHLRRCLLPWEVVHHRNGIKDDNRLENLMLLPSRTQHISDSLLKQYTKRLEKQSQDLKDENDVLKYELGM